MKRWQYWTVSVATMAAVTLTGCGSSSSKTAATTAAPATAAPTSAGPTTTIDQAAATALITANWTKFFDGKNTDFSSKMVLLENAAKIGNAYKQALAKSGPTGLQTSGVVDGVAYLSTSDCNDALGESVPCAKVTYDLDVNGKPALKAQIGYAVFLDGTWKVSQVTDCALSSLGGVPCPT